jgi:hypothetical protein
MLLDHVSSAQMQAGQILTGATMVGFMALPMFRRYGQALRICITVFYAASVLAFVIYSLVS